MTDNVRQAAEAALTQAATITAVVLPEPTEAKAVVPLTEAPPEVGAKIRKRMDELDLGDTGSIVAFGSTAQSGLQEISQAMLEGVRNKDVGPAGDSLRFQRTYFTTETQELALDGLGGDDVFEVTSSGAGKPIPLLLFGGGGHDTLHLQGPTSRLKLYDEAAGTSTSSPLRPHLPKKRHRAFDRLNDD